MHVHAHAGTRVHEATSLTGLVPERVQLTVHTTEPTGTVPEPFHCDHIARWSARSGTSGRSGTGLNTGNWNGSGTVLVSNLWCEHGLSVWEQFLLSTITLSLGSRYDTPMPWIFTGTRPSRHPVVMWLDRILNPRMVFCR